MVYFLLAWNDYPLWQAFLETCPSATSSLNIQHNLCTSLSSIQSLLFLMQSVRRNSVFYSNPIICALNAFISFLNGTTWLCVSPLVRLVNKSFKRRIALNKKPVSGSYYLVKPAQLQCSCIFFFIFGLCLTMHLCSSCIHEKYSSFFRIWAGSYHSVFSFK